MKWVRIATLLAAMFASAGCGTSPESYYPMKEGTEWKFRVDVLQSRIDSKSGKLVTEKRESTLSSAFLPKRELGGKTAVPRKDVFDGTQTSWSFLTKEAEGISRIAYQGPGSGEPQMDAGPSFLLRFPVQAGGKWDQTGASQLAGGRSLPMKAAVESVKDNIQVPAGKFPDCLRIRSEGSKEFDVPPYGVAGIRVVSVHWYAPKAGLVKAIVHEESGHFELGTVKYTFERLEPKP